MGNVLSMRGAAPRAARVRLLFDYCRGKWNVPSQCPIRLWITATALVAAALAAALPARAQYPGQITNTNKNTPTLRAVAVLEWTGDADHPKASRIVPVCIYDGQDLQDAGIYLARPAPIALESEVEYQLQQDGKPVGLFDIENAAREQGAWVGYGKLKPLPKPKPAPVQVAKIDEEDTQSDVPILHRKHHPGDSGGSGGSSSGSDSGQQGPPPDPDRPTLHKAGDASTGSSGSSSGDTSASGTASTQSTDSDRPTLHRSPDASSGSSTGSTTGNSGGASTSGTTSTQSSDTDRPKLKKKKPEDEGYVEDVATVTDPERPHLFRGKSAGFGAPVLPTLMGLPPDMHQEVAVSDTQNQPLHVWDYIWANPDDENKMKAGMENLARTALGLNTPPAPAAKPAPKTASTHKTAKPAAPPPPAPAPLLDEQFRVFELAYGSGATMVLSAHTDGAGAQQKFVTLIAQPDLYGNVAVLVKNVTDAAHLDDTPRMKLIDAIDAMADNRGELLFELRGTTQRQFALYRVLRGQATRLFVSGPDPIATSAATASN
jgi:hypothetical protein